MEEGDEKGWRRKKERMEIRRRRRRKKKANKTEKQVKEPESDSACPVTAKEAALMTGAGHLNAFRLAPVTSPPTP